jgi:hypothetical protein
MVYQDYQAIEGSQTLKWITLDDFGETWLPKAPTIHMTFCFKVQLLITA